MAETYTLNVAGLTRELTICKVNDHMDIAAFIMLGDAELTVAAAALTEEDGALLGHIFAVIGKLAKEQGLDNGYRVISNVGEDAGQTVKHLHFHVLGGEKLPV